MKKLLLAAIMVLSFLCISFIPMGKAQAEETSTSEEEALPFSIVDMVVSDISDMSNWRQIVVGDELENCLVKQTGSYSDLLDARNGDLLYGIFKYVSSMMYGIVSDPSQAVGRFESPLTIEGVFDNPATVVIFEISGYFGIVERVQGGWYVYEDPNVEDESTSESEDESEEISVESSEELSTSDEESSAKESIEESENKKESSNKVVIKKDDRDYRLELASVVSFISSSFLMFIILLKALKRLK